MATQKNRTILVKNAPEDPDTTVKIIVQNNISYTPRVSVIIPVYNASHYLSQCLDSVLHQKLQEIEVICVNDGSTDNSLAILRDYAARDKRITVLDQENLHAGVARNAGLMFARGEWVHFLDSDDWVKQNIFTAALDEIGDKDIDVYLFNYYNYNVKNDALSEAHIIKNAGNIFTFTDEAKYLLRTSVVPWNKLYKREYLVKNNLKFDNTVVANDRTFYFSLLFTNPRIMGAVDKMPRLTYRINSDTSLVGGSRIKNFENHFITFERYSNICAKTYPEYMEDVFDVFMLDNKYFYERANPDQREKVRTLIKDLLKSNEDQLAKYDLSKFTWFKWYRSIMTDNVYPVVFSTNDKYAKYLAVALQSLIENSNKNNFYHIYVFHSGLSQAAKNDILSVEADNIYTEFINVAEYVKQVNLYSRAHYSIEMYYRILIPRILSNYHRVLYLDCDIIILKDVAEIFREQLDNYYIGAVHNYVNYGHYNYLNKIGINPDDYFNSGVLLFNVDKWNELNLDKKCFELITVYKNLACPDQDILNLVCCDNVKYIYDGWNFMWQTEIGVTTLLPQYLPLYKKQRDNMCIIHYTSGIKPWTHSDRKYASYWWYYAQHTKLRKRFLSELNYARNVSDYYKRVTGKELNLRYPRTFNEKIQWLKLYDSTPIKTKLADKWLVRDWVREQIGEQYLIPTLGVYDKFEDIDFSKLPERFVIKCNHGSGYNIVVKDKSKLDISAIRDEVNKWMHENFAFKYGAELYYRDISPKIIIEKFIENEPAKDLYKYKFWCFNGKVKYILSERNADGLKMAFYSPNWKKQSFYNNNQYDEAIAAQPKLLTKMKNLAKKLSAGFKYASVGFYQLDDGTIYFNEIDFSPASGAMIWNKDSVNLKLGKMIKLPKRAYNIDTGKYYKFHHPAKLTAYILFPYYWLRVMIYRHRLHKMSVPRVSCSRRAIMDLINRDHKDLTAAINNLNNQYVALRSQIDAIKAVINKNTGMDKDSMLSFSLSELSRIPDQLETMVNILRNLDNKDIVADMLSIISQNMRQAVSDASAILAGHPENVNVYIEE